MSDKAERRRARQFGDDGKREWLLHFQCYVCGHWPVDPAHVGRTRGAGGGPERMAPLCRRCHRAYDSMGAERFEEVYGKAKERVIDYADWLEERWQRIKTELED